MLETIFRKILYAYDGSERAFDAFSLALAIAKQNRSELHIVSVAQIEYIPQFIHEVREQKATVVRRLRRFLFRARALAAERDVVLKSHVLVGRAVREIVRLADDLGVDLLIIGTGGHSSLYEYLVGSKAGQITQLAHCPVLVVKNSGPRRRVWRNLRRRLGLIQDAGTVGSAALTEGALALARAALRRPRH